MTVFFDSRSLRSLVAAASLLCVWACADDKKATPPPAIPPCEVDNGGCGSHATCVPKEDQTRECVCDPGYQDDGGECVDVDECKYGNGECDPRATCTNTPGSRTCACPAGELGDGSWCGMPWETVVVGAWHTCGIRPDGSLWCWGTDYNGELGIGVSNGENPAPVRVGTDTDWKQLYASAYFTCAQKDDDALWCWGRGLFGLFGDGTHRNSNVPEAAAETLKFSQVAVGTEHVCGLQADGALWCWGNSSDGQIGNGHFPEPTENAWKANPSQVEGTWERISVRLEHTCAIKTGGSLWCWGKNSYGELGDGTTERRNVPTQVGTDSDWADVTAGHSATCGLKTNGDVWCWGRNATFDKPSSSFAFELSPKQVWAGTAWTKVHLGASYACGEKEDGSLWCSGANEYGQAGVGTWDKVIPEPAQVGNTAWSEISIGQYNGCAKNPEGALFCWGYGGWGALGVGNEHARSRFSPVAVP